MDIKQIKKLIDIVKQNGVAELEVKEGGESIHIVLNKEMPLAASSMPGGYSQLDGSGAVTVGACSVSQQMVAATGVAREGQAAADGGSSNHNFAKENLVLSPMVGTAYLSPSPDSNTFVKIGDTVRTGDTLCLIEAMKMFNRIEATKDGVVTHVLVQDAQSVEYDQPLFVIE